MHWTMIYIDQLMTSNGNEESLHIPQSSRAGTLPLDSLVSYSGHSLGGGIRLPQWVSWYDTKQSDVDASGNAEYPFIAIALLSYDLA